MWHETRKLIHPTSKVSFPVSSNNNSELICIMDMTSSVLLSVWCSLFLLYLILIEVFCFSILYLVSPLCYFLVSSCSSKLIALVHFLRPSILKGTYNAETFNCVYSKCFITQFSCLYHLGVWCLLVGWYSLNRVFFSIPRVFKWWTW